MLPPPKIFTIPPETPCIQGGAEFAWYSMLKKTERRYIRKLYETVCETLPERLRKYVNLKKELFEQTANKSMSVVSELQPTYSIYCQVTFALFCIVPTSEFINSDNIPLTTFSCACLVNVFVGRTSLFLCNGTYRILLHRQKPSQIDFRN